jgi:ankyrin repeat protein
MYWLSDTFNGFLSMLFHNVCDEESPREFRPIFQAVERGAISRVQEYLSKGGDVDTRNRYGQTLLMAAAIYKWPKIVQVLLAHSAKVDTRDRKGRTPLHHAARHSIDCVKLLLAAGADPKARDRKGKSVLAEWSYKADQILRAHGAED